MRGEREIGREREERHLHYFTTCEAWGSGAWTQVLMHLYAKPGVTAWPQQKVVLKDFWAKDWRSLLFDLSPTNQLSSLSSSWFRELLPHSKMVLTLSGQVRSIRAPPPLYILITMGHGVILWKKTPSWMLFSYRSGGEGVNIQGIFIRMKLINIQIRMQMSLQKRQHLFLHHLTPILWE